MVKYNYLEQKLIESSKALEREKMKEEDKKIIDVIIITLVLSCAFLIGVNYA